ncbi:MAG TPA: polysaccharide deacetylase family protein [Frateuria sp.]|uniref:polysaccharide deacetylase family protein n=1 Tax=Frateuria sp. TaxID=2211372 RepID=UPI002DF0211B|nr:polysaccharide deacetylase family protein [Frateuria sp.]
MRTPTGWDEPARGMRGRLGALCHRGGLLRLFQHVRGWIRQDLRVLAYHRVLPMDDPDRFDFDLDLVSASAEGFRGQMQLLRQRFRPMTLSQVLATLEAGERLPVDAVAVTFDDGYDDNFRFAFPILRELDIPATFFVSTGHIDNGQPYAYDWLVHMILRTQADELAMPELGLACALPNGRPARRRLAQHLLDRLKSLDGADQAALITRLEADWNLPRAAGHPDCTPMSWTQLRQMHAAGFEIGSHGVHHRMLAKLPQEELEAELRESRAALERELGTPVSLVSYPVGGEGAFDERVVQATRAAGYRAACSYICGTNPLPAPDRYALYRLPVERQMDTGWFAAMLTLPELVSYPSTQRGSASSGAPAAMPG